MCLGKAVKGNSRDSRQKKDGRKSGEAGGDKWGEGISLRRSY